jgi:hypothetical protein
MIMVWLRLAMALSLLLLVACEDETNDIEVVNSQEHVDPAELVSNARLEAPSADATKPVGAAITDTIQPVDVLTADTPQPIDDPDSYALGDMSIPMMRWTGDLDDMEKERTIRILTVYGLGRYFLDGVIEKGKVYEKGRLLEGFINERLGRKNVRIHVVIIPPGGRKPVSGSY